MAGSGCNRINIHQLHISSQLAVTARQPRNYLVVSRSCKTANDTANAAAYKSFLCDFCVECDHKALRLHSSINVANLELSGFDLHTAVTFHESNQRQRKANCHRNNVRAMNISTCHYHRKQQHTNFSDKEQDHRHILSSSTNYHTSSSSSSAVSMLTSGLMFHAS